MAAGEWMACCFFYGISFTFPFRGMGFVVNCLYKVHFSKEENHG